MKIVFFGTPLFAANTLSFLLKNNVDVVAIMSRIDQPKGRSKKLLPTPVKTVALEHTPPLLVFQPQKGKTSNEEFAHQLEHLQPDLFVIVAYGEILKQNILDIPHLGCINLHGSLLPKYRGAAPIQRCIMNGETETGVTIMHLVRKMDAGPMIKTVKTSIGPDETFGQIEKKLCEIGSQLLLEVIRDFEKGSVNETPQDEAQATYAQKIELEDCEIDWNQSAETIHHLVRGVSPYPGAWCYVMAKGEKKRLKIKESRVLKEMSGKPAQILPCDSGDLVIACGTGALRLLKLQLEGKKEMVPKALLRGAMIEFIT